jgi:hypothetical protein
VYNWLFQNENWGPNPVSRIFGTWPIIDKTNGRQGSIDFRVTTSQNDAMPDQFNTSYLKESIDLYRYYKRLGESAIEQAPEATLFITLDPESNSIATIIKHMAGNMRSRWSDFLTTDGEKPARNRDGEFEEPAEKRAQN